MYKIRTKEKYEEALKTGMFFVWYPTLTGNWQQDRDQICCNINTQKLNELVDAVKNYVMSKKVYESSKIKDGWFLKELENDFKNMTDIVEEVSFNGYEEEYDPFAPKLIPFKEIKVGQRFRFGKEIFLRLHLSLSYINCVNLTSCHVVEMDLNTEVHAL